MKKILIVDDEPDTRFFLKNRLRANQFDVLEAGDGAAGIALAARQHPDLILLDLMIPEEDGILTYRALRRNPDTEGIPVIFLTALSSSTSPMTKQSLQLLAKTKHGVEMDENFWVMGKPYQPQELMATIKLVLGQVLTGGR